MQCPQCGQHNQPGDRFCSNCGTRLDGASSIPRQFDPLEREAPSEPTAATQQQDRIPENPTDPEWRMSPLPEEEPPKRRTWLWVLIGLVLLCVLLFCAFGIFITFTDTGQDLMDDLATTAAEQVATPVD